MTCDRLLDLEERVNRIESTTVCMATTDIEGYTYKTSCDATVHGEDWGKFTFCPSCGKRLVGHDVKADG